MTAIPDIFKTEEDLEPCTFCRRRFAPKRINVHESICGKSSTSNKAAQELERIVDEMEEKIGSGSRMLMTNWRHRRERLLKEIKTRKNSQSTREKNPALFDCDSDDGQCYDSKKLIENVDVQNVNAV